MLSNEKIFVRGNNLKAEAGVVLEYVRTYIRENEFLSLQKNKVWKDGVTFFQEECVNLDIKDKANADITSLTKEEIMAYYPEKGPDFLKKLEEYKDLSKEVDSLKYELLDFNALSRLDRTFIILQARKAYKPARIDKSILKDFDFQPLIKSYYTKGSISKMKDQVKQLFRKAVELDNGELFYPVKLKKSNFTEKQIRCFCSSFCRGGNMPVSKTKDGKKSYGRFDYKVDTSNEAVLTAATELFAVVLDSKNEYEVIK